MKKERYVVGFAFSPDKEHVLLIQKTHPAWQAGKWNGIGGHIEEGESPEQAMVREAKEETGITRDFEWDHYATMWSDDFECFVFSGTAKEVPFLQFDSGEKLHFWKLPLKKLPRLADSDFLIEAALVKDSFVHLTISYKANGSTGQTK